MKDNYPPDYHSMKHIIDDFEDEVEEVAEFDDSDEYRENNTVREEEDEIPLFDSEE